MIKKMNAIANIRLTALKNELHVQFHKSSISLVTLVGLEKLPFVSLFNLYKAAFNNESEALLIIVKSEYTPQIAEQDSKRDNLFRGFVDIIKGYRNHFNSEHRAAANKLWNLIKHFGNVPRKSLDAETAAISDFIREFKRPEILAAADTLDVNEWIIQLTNENDHFHELMMARYNETTKKTTYRMKTARVETDRYYRAIVATMEQQVLLATVTQEQQHFITELNAIVTHFKNILAHEMGRKKKTEN